MDLSSLQYAKNSRKDRKRVGRGGARGKTAGRGMNGQRSRSGSKQKIWFEGGQMPIQRRLPKRGFTNINKIKFQVLNVGDLKKLKGVKEVTPEVLYKKGAISSRRLPVKILGRGEIKKEMSISANAFSKTAIEKIEGAGGRITKL